jgi:hypothetical protein
MSQWTPSNCITYWFPKLAESGAKVPRTHILHAPGELLHMCDGKDPYGYADFVKLIEFCCSDVGYPCFFRMGDGSGKHSWKDCCWISSPADIPGHLYQTVEDQACKDLDTDIVVIREGIRTRPLFHAFWGEMPITREFRFFVEIEEKTEIEDGPPGPFGEQRKILSLPTYEPKITHIQPYWPAEAIDGHRPDRENWAQLLQGVSTLSAAEHETLTALVLAAMSQFHGTEGWSVDVLQDRAGEWWFTDMALAGCSYRWEPDFDVVTN